MPFPLAHPAAVLPLRRFCPRFFSFPALLIGSVSPDAGYCFWKWNDTFPSHHLLGSVVYCVPLSLIGLWILYRTRLPVAGRLPSPYRDAFETLCQRPPAAVTILIISILVGAWTHLLLDDLTHKDGWMVERLELLRTPVFAVGYQTLRVCHLLWYACTFAGVFYILLAFLKWWSDALHSRKVASARARVRVALLFTGLMLPVAVFHHLVHHRLEIVAVCCLTLLIGVAFAWFLHDSAPPPPSPRGPDSI